MIRISAVAALLLLNLIAFAAAQSAKITIDADSHGIPVSRMLYGIFFEEINRAGDGGLYAEMVQNRSLEDAAELPIAWNFVAEKGAKATCKLDRSRPLNEFNRTAIRIDVESFPRGSRVALINRGFVGCPRSVGESDPAYAARFDKAAGEQASRGHGIALRGGAEYLVSLYARTSGNPAALIVALESADGNTLASQRIDDIGEAWQKHGITLAPSSDATDAKLVISPTAAGTSFLDMVSLFPRDTFKGRANGMRKDLAEMVVAMKPAFMRFPGGCFVEGDEISDAVRWKKTIGDVAARPGHRNLWGYRSSDGLGLFEYLQFCQDIGAEPLLVINAGMSHHAGKGNAYAVPLSDMHEYVQDAMDAIEYCNGPADSKWGSLRAAAGHPAPFHLKYMEIGNENGGPAYHERYALFHDAIKAKYRQMQLIANVWEGVPTNPFDLKDEHYYNSPAWFLSHANHYDGYERNGAHVYVGEYAVTQGCGLGNLAAAIGEAAFMTGMERNSAVVRMASYAPLFCEPAWKAWNPNAINFDASRVYGTPSYHLQVLFAGNRPDVILPANVEINDAAQDAPRGRIGIGTWDTQAEFKDLTVTSPDGKTLWQFDATRQLNQFETTGGDWQIVDGVIRQTSSATPAMMFAGERSWGDYTITCKARKTGGSEGFLISFHSTDPAKKSWWNIGGWGNREHAIEVPDTAELHKPGGVETGRWYDIKVALRGNAVRCYLAGQEVQKATAGSSRRLIVVAGRDDEAGEVVIKAVNPADKAIDAEITLQGVASVAPEARAIVLTSDRPEDENSMQEPNKVTPRQTQIGAGRSFAHTFPPHAITVLRLGFRRDSN